MSVWVVADDARDRPNDQLNKDKKQLIIIINKKQRFEIKSVYGKKYIFFYFNGKDSYQQVFYCY